METLKPLIEQLTAMIKEGYDIGKGQMPDVAKQIFRYSMWKEILMFVFFSVMASAVGYFSFCLFQRASCGISDGYWIGTFILGAVCIGFLISCSGSLDAILKIRLAPKAFILDEIASYTQGYGE